MERKRKGKRKRKGERKRKRKGKKTRKSKKKKGEAKGKAKRKSCCKKCVFLAASRRFFVHSTCFLAASEGSRRRRKAAPFPKEKALRCTLFF